MSAASAAYIKLAEYYVRCREKAAALPSQQDLVQYWSGIGFTLDGVRYVAPLDEVSEILKVPPYTRVPGVLNWMKGVANVRGRLMTVMDLTGFLDKPSALQERRRRLLVIDEGELYTGLTVDDVLGMQHFPVDGYVSEAPALDDAVRPYTLGAYQRDNEYWPVLSLFRLADDPRFLQVARTG
ncbi:type IV pili signal transduction protein PilI [Alcanivorax sp. S71-1-4]|jgi:twitching motility protein PilI|uniref:chemotaxis protein CheW n=1 Tax=Alcanivorax sp. S71-1-4 TaxID=1177159 RepID=UPI001358EC34|nr:chemotaxis protein CheW [Alcanivorax sp. S71-1-4]KAF0810933.1 type IV pili signal transduction protein PilI [Alcanivorax sp. S71-1-4]